MGALKHFEAPDEMPPVLGNSIYKAFGGSVGAVTCNMWAEDLFKYDPFVVKAVTGHMSGIRRPGYHVIHYMDYWENILTFIIKLN